MRDPSDRLLSFINHHSIGGSSLDKINEMIDERNKDFENCIHKYIFDYGLDGSISSSFNSNDQKIHTSIDHIDFIDISDSSTISKIKSSSSQHISKINWWYCSKSEFFIVNFKFYFI